MDTSTTKRKLIDLDMPVFTILSQQARKEGISLKKYIENLLEAEAEQRRPSVPTGVTDPRILSLIGVAKNAVENEEAESDERLQYILSK